ncbi:hypothetical protein [Bifidobacterium pseudocatenulatum]|uniref:hypothetical protein n=1 Tax=Bifidobacterium pseudocatenulatum TaxID=28026 RepID=UPI0032E00E0D
MDDLNKVDKTLIVTVAGLIAIALLTGFGIYASWYAGTHPDYGMTTVKTGDVTWACLTDHGTTIGCDTVEEYK